MNHHRFGIYFSSQPVRIASPAGEYTVMSCSMNTNLQIASQMSPIPTRVLVKDSMIWYLHDMSAPFWGMGSISNDVDNSTLPVAVPTHSFVAK